jgi:hypothetical protein
MTEGKSGESGMCITTPRKRKHGAFCHPSPSPFQNLSHPFGIVEDQEEGYRSGKRNILHGRAGEVFGLLGPNGAGKTPR